MQTFLLICFLSIASIGTRTPPAPPKKKMVVEIALGIILQSLKVFPSVRNKNSENSENPEITPSATFITESTYKTYFEHKCIILTT